MYTLIFLFCSRLLYSSHGQIKLTLPLTLHFKLLVPAKYHLIFPSVKLMVHLETGMDFLVIQKDLLYTTRKGETSGIQGILFYCILSSLSKVIIRFPGMCKIRLGDGWVSDVKMLCFRLRDGQVSRRVNIKIWHGQLAR